MAVDYRDTWTWTPAQIVALVLGLIFTVLGGVVLLRTGVSAPFTQQAVTLGIAHTPLLGAIELIVGLSFLGLGAFPGASNGVVFLGVLNLAFGLLLIIEPTRFAASIGDAAEAGVLFALAGLLALIAGLVTPSVMRRRVTRTTVTRDVGPAMEQDVVREAPTQRLPDHGHTRR